MASFDLKNLDFKTAGFWPQPMKLAAYALAFAAVLVAGWFLYLSAAVDSLHSLESKEQQLRGQYEDAQTKANNLPELQRELAQINDLLKTLVTRLPNKNEIPELVIDVSQAALNNGLQVDLFQQQDEIKHDFYAEKQINVKFRGQYHQLGAFFSDIAKQPRLVAVVIDGLKVDALPPPAAGKTSDSAVINTGAAANQMLSFTGKVLTYRYLSQDEEDQIAKDKAEKAKKAKKSAKKSGNEKAASK